MKLASASLLLAALAAGSATGEFLKRYPTHNHAPASRGTHRYLEKKTAEEKAVAKEARQAGKKAAEAEAEAEDADEDEGEEDAGEDEKKTKKTAEEKAAAKEARLAAKAAKKAAKEAAEAEAADEDGDEEGEDEDETKAKTKKTAEEKAAAKEARLAAKAAKKAAEAENNDTDDEDKKETKRTKEEKQAAKEARQAAKEEKRRERKPKNMPKKKAKVKKVKPKKKKMGGMMMDSKKKKQLPDNCSMETVDKEVPCPPVPPIPLPKKCAGVSASWSGDPHFKTFDRKGKYDCQGEGEFHVVKSLDSDFNLQGRFVKYLDKRTPTVTKSVALDTGDGEPIVQVNVPNDSKNGCSPYIFLDGEKVTVQDDKTFEGVRIKKTATTANEGYIFYYENTDVQLQVWSKVSKSNGCVIAAELCIPDCYHRRTEDFVGLLGTPDGDPNNDWRDKNGDVVPFSTKSKDEYAYCTQNWCIEEETDSLFAYEEGQSFASLNKCSDAPETKTEACVNENLNSETPTELSATCGKVKSCLLDGCLGGVAAAEDYVRANLNMVDKNCGTEVYVEDFEDDVDTSIWGDITEKEATLESPESTSFLQFAQGSSEIQNSIDIPDGTMVVVLEFLFYEIGGWQAEVDSLENNAYVFIGENAVDIGSYDDEDNEAGDVRTGFVDGTLWHISTMTESGDLGFGSGGGDKIQKVSFRVPAADLAGTFSFGISSMITPGSDNEGGGIDDLRITAFMESCSIDCDGSSVAVEDFEDSDQSDWGTVTQINGGKTILGPLFDGSDPIQKAFEISPYAESAEVEFELYEVDDWMGDPLNKFLVTIGTDTFDLGLTMFSDVEDSKGAFASGTVGDDGGIYWERTTTAFGADLGIGSQADDKIHQVLITVAKSYFEGGTLFVGFDVEANDGKVAAGLDGFKLSVFPDKEECEGAKQESEENLFCPTNEENPFVGKKCYKQKTKKFCSPTVAPNDPPTSAPNDAPTPPPDDPPDDPPASPPNNQPTKAPASPPTFITGDPHIRKWNGETYDFHGGCDLVLVSDPDFKDGLGLFIHVRTKITRWWSSIESAAIKIGDDVLEIKAGIKNRQYWFNGGEAQSFKTSMNFPFTVGGFSGRYRYRNDRMIQYKLFLDRGQNITIRSVKDMLRVELEQADADDFGTSFGLMGSFGDGELVGRDGTIFNDLDAFGNEWQVTADDPQLFHKREGPQFPEKCDMPSTSETSRRLVSVISHDEAEAACVGADVSQDQMVNCIYDIQAMDDVDAALNY